MNGKQEAEINKPASKAPARKKEQPVGLSIEKINQPICADGVCKLAWKPTPKRA